ncbi:MAG: hypothetical protein A3D16_18555 [Rhodobacterales bacterium RIFCSPHIGHO2_02_FULL_62_130]|nr:MAG: hypothetical protein A3D16_18555 [Rhodobacterales bacterium RIFCSPHIGHO2_02_FULL_62_130]OHC60310.1 MAG: hypothetical protein A3E48_18580 [Rhodobacterales bacterium RIFCSPHIGHO2_12_FULL_62_75]HCZ01546.1 hypothetical protein [Rhodobacter sp.]
MMLLSIAKKTRTLLMGVTSSVAGASEVALGMLLSIVSSRLVPCVPAKDRARDSLIVCPSPLLDQQIVNPAFRGHYVISFVNSACLSPTFQTLKPERMFLIDPAFFQDHPAGDEVMNSGVERTLARIAVATDWPMSLMIPWHYRHSAIVKWIQANPNIRIVGLPVCNARSHNKFFKKLGLRLGVVNPVYQNVLIAAVFYSLKAGHTRTLIWGGHHNWLAEVAVDGHNQVLHSVRHSGEQHVGVPLVDMDGSPRLYHTYLRQLATVFEQYHVIRDYTRGTGQVVLNATAESFIDAFERIDSISLFSPKRDDDDHKQSL